MHLVLLVGRLKELPIHRSVCEVLKHIRGVGIAHLMKSASSELEALIGGVLLGPASFLEPPEAKA